MLEDLKRGLCKYRIVKEFLADIKRELEGGDEETVKLTELKRLKQGGKTIEEFV